MTPEYNSLVLKILRNYILEATLQANNHKVKGVIRSIAPQVTQNLIAQNSNEKSMIEDTVKDIFIRLENLVSLDNLKHLWLEIILCQNIHIFEFYITQMIMRVFINHPGILTQEKQTIRMDEILECKTVEEIILRVAARKVQKLSHDGLLDKIQFLKDILRMKFNTEMPEFIDIYEMFQVRNIIVHNDSIVNEIYLQNTKRRDLPVGSLYPLTEDYVNQGGLKLINVGLVLDKSFVSHFKLS